MRTTQIKQIFVWGVVMLLIAPVFAQKKKKNKKIKYAPVTEISREEAWPIVAQAVAILGIKVESFEYGKGVLKTGYYEYKKGFIPNRGKILFLLKDNTLNIDMAELQLKETNTKKWVATYPDPLFPKEKQIKAEIAEAVRKIHQTPEAKENAFAGFANNISFHSFFFATASELAGEIWFKQFLQDKDIQWNLVFQDVQKSKTEGFAYEETLGLANSQSPLKIIRRTQSDANVFTNKGSVTKIQGKATTCVLEEGTWKIIVEDQ